MKILSLSSVYPNPSEPGLGLFVRSRLEQMAARADVKVIAPIPLLDYSNPKGTLLRHRTFPLKRQDGAIEVYHPRWLFPPKGTPANVLCEFFRMAPLVCAIRRTFPFDMIDAHFGYPEGAAAAHLAALVRVPFTITLRGSETVFAASPARRLVLRWAMRRAAHVITVSNDLRDFAIREGVAPNRATTVPNGIDSDIFHLRDAGAARHRQRLPPGRRLIVSAGELIEAKGHHLLIQAAKTLLRRGIDLEVLVAGGTARGGQPYEHQLQSLIADLGLEDRVRLIGWVDRETMADLLSAADLFCLASFTEGWPNVVNEALACGTPVVASAVGGVPAMLPGDTYGITVPPASLSLLVEALDRGLGSTWDRAAISSWGRSRTWSNVAAEVIRIHQSLIPSKEPRAFAGEPEVQHVRH
jgi:teichuronic acid biosynthesis glycosyltransferase TuaC